VPPTIREVAREAGVSIATVSHALSGKRPVSAATRRRITRAARRLGYRPNRLAASMITGRTHTLGMIVPDIGNPFFGGLCAAAERAAAERGYAVVVCSSELDAELEARSTEVLRDRRVDALVYLAGTAADNAALGAVADAGIQIVALDEAVESLPAAASLLAVDNESGGALAARHLVELGHRDVAVISGDAALPTARARLGGFATACRESGVRLPRRRIRNAPYTVEGGCDAARALLEADGEVTAIFCGNDLIALGALDVLVVSRRNRQHTMMTKQEIKDEAKSTEGDPHVRGQRRSRQLAMARNRMMSAIPAADVVMLNPTHVAVALQYEPGKSAPRVVAKGSGEVAARIRERAAEHRVERSDNP
jgi:DNA-binding LacI/PurR family transcriptional regulator